MFLKAQIIILVINVNDILTFKFNNKKGFMIKEQPQIKCSISFLHNFVQVKCVFIIRLNLIFAIPNLARIRELSD